MAYSAFEGAVVAFEVFTVHVFLSACLQKRRCSTARRALAYTVLCCVLGIMSIFSQDMVLLPIATAVGVICLAAALYEGHFL